AGGSALPRGTRGTRGRGAAVPRHGWGRPWLVPVRRAAALRRGSRRDGPRPRRVGSPEQALSAGHPPDELLPRALRSPRGRVSGVRGRGAAVAGAAVLPGHERGRGGAGRRGAAHRGRAGACRAAPRLGRRVPLPRAPTPRLPPPQRLARVRSPSLAP